MAAILLHHHFHETQRTEEDASDRHGILRGFLLYRGVASEETGAGIHGHAHELVLCSMVLLVVYHKGMDKRTRAFQNFRPRWAIATAMPSNCSADLGLEWEVERGQNLDPHQKMMYSARGKDDTDEPEDGMDWNLEHLVEDRLLREVPWNDQQEVALMDHPF